MSTIQTRSSDTRARLLAAGRVAFSERGHDAVNLTSDILKPAGVSVGSFYHQFADKTELLIAILDVAATQRKATVFNSGTTQRRRSFDADIADLVNRFFDSLDDNGHLWRIQVRERTNTHPQIRDRILAGRQAWATELTAAIAPHNNRDEDALAQAVELILTFCIGLIAVYIDLPAEVRAVRRETLPGQVSQFLCRGTRPLLGIPTPRNTTRAQAAAGKRKGAAEQ